MVTLLGGTDFWLRRYSSNRLSARYLVDIDVVPGSCGKGMSAQSVTMVFYIATYAKQGHAQSIVVPRRQMEDGCILPNTEQSRCPITCTGKPGEQPNA